MATKSFLKNISIKNKTEATSFIEALEHAEGKKRKKVHFDKMVEDVTDRKKIKEIFDNK